MAQARDALLRQFRAELDMLSCAVEACPEWLWADDVYPNRFWHVAYHALFFTHLYLSPSPELFQAWDKHREKTERLGEPAAPAYTKDEIREYLAFCRRRLEPGVQDVDLDAASGFPWLPFRRLEVHMYNLRHLAHHTGQLLDRLRNSGQAHANWVRGT